ncbi:MAG: 30S ribosomal protein S20 [Planctomycetes bacterium]|nr:30S ribosomal protein S20 [Planctomycetota bacterium]
MPTSLQATKRVRQNEKRRIRNKGLRSVAKTFSKKVVAAVQAGNLEAAEKELRTAFQKIDKAAKKSVFHRNNAARRKARLARMVHALEVKSRGAAPSA